MAYDLRKVLDFLSSEKTRRKSNNCARDTWGGMNAIIAKEILYFSDGRVRRDKIPSSCRSPSFYLFVYLFFFFFAPLEKRGCLSGARRELATKVRRGGEPAPAPTFSAATRREFKTILLTNSIEPRVSDNVGTHNACRQFT